MDWHAVKPVPGQMFRHVPSGASFANHARVPAFRAKLAELGIDRKRYAKLIREVQAEAMEVDIKSLVAEMSLPISGL